MKTYKPVTILLVLVFGLVLSPTPIQAQRLELGQGVAAPNPLAPLGTTITYQGRLDNGGSPADGIFDFEFKLYDALTGGAQVGTTVTIGDLPVNQGLFTAALDFGAVFDGTALYLAIGVRPGSSTGAYTALAPRQALTAAPYALHAPGSPYQNVVVVAKSGGDFSSVQTAIDSVTDAAASNPYLVWVAPGTYSETVTMKPYVHLQGAGQEATVISSTVSNSVGAWPLTQATLILARDTSLRDLTVVNSGTADTKVALLATAGVTRTLAADVAVKTQASGVINYAIYLTSSGTGVRLQQVTALAESGSIGNYALFNRSGAAAILRGGSFTGRGGNDAKGIVNTDIGTTLVAESVTALGEDGITNNGLYNSTTATLRGGSFTGRGGDNAEGIYNTGGDTTLETESVTALGEDGSTESNGLFNGSSAMATLRGGSFTGRGGNTSQGINNSGSNLEAESVSALGENGNQINYGLKNGSSAIATLRGGSFTGREGNYARGIYNNGTSTILEAESVTALGENGNQINDGLSNGSSAIATLRGGSFTGREGNNARGINNVGTGTILEAESITALGENGSIGSYGLRMSESTVRLAVSQLHGGADKSGGTLTCFAVYDENYVFFGCPP